MADLSADLSAPGVTGFAYDSANGLLYLATLSGEVLRWDASAGTFLSPIYLGGDLSTIAVTPDGSTLLVGHADVTTNAQFAYAKLDRVSLSDGSVVQLTPPSDLGQSSARGVTAIATLASGQAFVSVLSSGLGILSEFPANSNSNVYDYLDTASAIQASADGQHVLIDDGSKVEIFDSSSNAVIASANAPFIGELSMDINDEAGLVVLDGNSNIDVYDEGLHLVKDLSSLQSLGNIVSAHFSADGKDLFLLDAGASEVHILDTSSWAQVGVIPISGMLAAGQSEEMTVTPDGHFLFVQTLGGVESIDLSTYLGTGSGGSGGDGNVGVDAGGVIANSGGGGAIITVQLPGQTTTDVSSDYVVTSDEHLVYDEYHSPVFTLIGQSGHPGPNLTIDGYVELSSSTYQVLTGVADDGSEDFQASLIKVSQSGTLLVDATIAGSGAWGYLNTRGGAASVENDGLWSITGSALAYGVVFGGSGANFTNTGTFTVTGGAATGVWGDGYNFDNTGHFTVTGATAVGVDLGQVGFFPSVQNSGDITATNTGGGQSTGLRLSGDYQTVDITNSGSITADVAVQVYAGQASNGVPVVDLNNSGVINGVIDLSAGAPFPQDVNGYQGSQIFNTGAINGNIAFDNGNILYDGAAGTLSGIIYLGSGTDRVILGADGETVHGGSGYDDIIGGAGNDVFDGVGGQATFSYENAAAGVTVSLAISGPQNTGGAGTDTLVGVNDLVGSAFNDTLTASGSHQALEGGAGDDTLIAGTGNEVLDGGPGTDTAEFSGPASAFTVTQTSVGYTVSGPDGTDSLYSIEILKFADSQVVLGNAETLTMQAGDFNGDGVSDFLIENTSGAVFVGEAEHGQAAYTQVSALGPEWSFHGSGDFLGNGDTDFLIQNTSGVVAVGDVHGGQTSYTTVAGLGPEWSFEGTGDFLGDGKSDFLIQNAAGVVAVGEVVSGQAQYTAVTALGPEWSFKGAGDFLGDGKSDFLIENAAGVVAVGEVVSGQAQYTTVAGLGPEWSFKETGDFLGDGKDDFLIENAAGVVAVGEVVGGQAQYTAIAALGPEWKFVGAGDYLGEGHEQFLIENSAGAIDIGDWTGGQIHYTQIAGLGSEWVFH